VVVSAGKTMELQRTNQVWRMGPIPMEARVNGDKVADALEKLEGLRAVQFFDNPKNDLDAFGLQTPELSLAFKRGTNTTLLLAFGKNPSNDISRVYARRNDEKTIVTVANDLLEPWRGSHETFRDRHLVSPTGPLAAIEIHAQDQFTLLRTNKAWLVAPQNFPGDAALIEGLLTHLTNLQVTQFVKDVVVDWTEKKWGLSAPSYQIILLAAVTNGAGGMTNVPVAEVDFGTNQNDLIYARRADEASVYAVRLADFQQLPANALQLRERQIWRFTENDIARITVQRNGKTLQLERKGTNQWSIAAGQGMINPFALEETAHRLGELAAESWVQRGDQDRERFGFKPDGHRLTIELKNGQKLGVEFGGIASVSSQYAQVTLDGELWIFEFPPALYQFVDVYLTIKP